MMKTLSNNNMGSENRGVSRGVARISRDGENLGDDGDLDD